MGLLRPPKKFRCSDSLETESEAQRELRTETVLGGSAMVFQYVHLLQRVTMLPVFLVVASLVIEADLSESHCLGSDVLCTTADYQLRRYNESVWVGTHVDINNRPTVDTFIQPLNRYLSGENSAGLRIKSTGHFLISFAGDGEITMYLMVPEELWENPPTPTSPETFITRFPTMDVFARRIRGTIRTQANDLNHTLTEQNAKFNKSFFFVSLCIGYSKRSIHSSLGAYHCDRRRGGLAPPGADNLDWNFFWGPEVTIGGVSYDFSSIPACNEVWFVASGGMDCTVA
ncbi:uncharacterized protein LOC134342030 isoform X2 [Mobula hypostoma]|uniref:uncharacterized protein LOC134342030 isoform X2 n=1 Tax=Mobula hypostoma TaxID=723540 RepID=UPI002FC2F1BA